MTALASIWSRTTDRAPAERTEHRVLRMLRAMRPDQDQVFETAAVASAAVGSIAPAWERALQRGRASVAERGPIVVVADAFLTHTDDLARRVGTGTDARAGDAAIILAAYERFGLDAFGLLEGEFAAIVIDAQQDRRIAARDFAGQRALHFAATATELLLATSVGGLLADPTVPQDLDVVAVATSAAGLWSHSARTAYRAIEELPAGHLLLQEGRTAPRVRGFADLPIRIRARRAPIDTAAEELRGLLVDAVRERLDPGGPTALSLSGGWDSSAVAGAAAIAAGATVRERLRPVSFSYPVGDPGREDEIIEGILGHLGLAPHWIPVDDVPMLADAAAAAQRRDLPFAHAFERWNRALSRAARAVGARVILDGVGGDQLFQVSDIYLADLFARGRWIEMHRQWRARGGRGLRSIWRWGIRPALPPIVPRLLARMRGLPPPPHHFHRQPSPWMVHRFLEREGVLARDATAAPALPRGSLVMNETHAYLRFPFFARVASLLRTFAADEGVALRSPLLDDRVVRWAVQRPWDERADGRETKVALRRAMRGLLPDAVLAPRPHRTGITSAYFLRQLRGPGRAVIESALADPLLASLGVIDGARLRRAWAWVLEHDDDELGSRILSTVQAELWMRAHHSPARTTDA